MRKSRTLSLSLDPEHVERLDRLAREFDSRSEAVRMLLDDSERNQSSRELEQAYQEYYSQPGAAEAEAALTRELLSHASWP